MDPSQNPALPLFLPPPPPAPLDRAHQEIDDDPGIVLLLYALEVRIPGFLKALLAPGPTVVRPDDPGPEAPEAEDPEAEDPEAEDPEVKTQGLIAHDLLRLLSMYPEGSSFRPYLTDAFQAIMTLACNIVNPSYSAQVQWELKTRIVWALIHLLRTAEENESLPPEALGNLRTQVTPVLDLTVQLMKFQML